MPVCGECSSVRSPTLYIVFCRRAGTGCANAALGWYGSPASSDFPAWMSGQLTGATTEDKAAPFGIRAKSRLGVAEAQSFVGASLLAIPIEPCPEWQEWQHRYREQARSYVRFDLALQQPGWVSWPKPAGENQAINRWSAAMLTRLSRCSPRVACWPYSRLPCGHCGARSRSRRNCSWPSAWQSSSSAS